jgi:hypothetical protein
VTTDGYYVLKQGQKYSMPGDLGQLLTTRLLNGFRSKIQAIRFFATLNRIESGKIQNISFQNWIDQNIRNSDLTDHMKMVARITTFADDVGVYGRPDVKIPGIKNIYIVGDWVGPLGLLVDTSISSAKRAAEHIMKTRMELEMIIIKR